MTKDEFMALVTCYTEACDDLGAGLFDQTAEQSAEKHKAASDLWQQLGAEVERLHAEAVKSERLRALLPEWRPIETAPRDGTTVLLWEKYEYEPFIGHWHGPRGRWVASTTYYNTDGDAGVVDTVYSVGVTHWMPLPAPPAKEPMR